MRFSWLAFIDTTMFIVIATQYYSRSYQSKIATTTKKGGGSQAATATQFLFCSHFQEQVG